MGRIAAALTALSVAASATLAVPIAVRRMIDHGFSSSGAGLIDAYFAVMVAVVGVLALASGARFYLVATLGERVVADLRDAVFRHLTTLDASFFDTAHTGELLSRLTADTTQIKSAIGASASVALRNSFMFFGAVVMMVISSPKLSGLVFIVLPLIVFPFVAAGRTVRKQSRKAHDRLADATAFAAENLAAVRTMQAYGAERRTADRFRTAADAAYMAAQGAARSRAMLTVIALFLAFASIVGVLWLGAQDVLAGRIKASGSRRRTKTRFRLEMFASIPARKFFSLRYTQWLLTMSATDRPHFLWKAASRTPNTLAPRRLAALA